MNGERLRVRYCRACQQTHWCDAPISQCFCPACSSDQIETVEPDEAVRRAAFPERESGVGL